MIHPSAYMWLAPLIAMVVAQGLKPLFVMGRLRTWDWRQVRTSGGMPSSHTAAVVALAVELWMRYGGSDPILGIGFFLAAVVMYDAAGVRWQTGQQAAVLNRLLRDLKGQDVHADAAGAGEIGRTDDANRGANVQEESHRPTSPNAAGIRPLKVVKMPWWLIDWPILNEHVGHKPTEIVGGAIVGILVALLVH
ncbi:divergent PAP2 family protein [Alicyclobacillus acidiphilus]|uniref:divergent PAP2 family protein n=1 Tax=Alicyclobacillus acidiphilus TaxID=182455 RepID=UPI00082D296A|nr:divergent PAP2 family protein [Alicyclobacillus acidiphilus]